MKQSIFRNDKMTYVPNRLEKNKFSMYYSETPKCIVPLYKGKGDKYVCSNFRGISLLSVVGKVYGRVLIERIRRETESVIGEEQCGIKCLR
jgi:hypothetical protein